MAENSKIEWTEATWNPIVGCSIVSPGCTNCYAMKMAARLERIGVPHYAGLTQGSKGGAVWTGKLEIAPDKTLTAPLRRRKPTVYFVNSMGDLFHEDVPDEWINKVFAVMAISPRHTFQVLTKRAKRMRSYLTPRATVLRIDQCAVAMVTSGSVPKPAPTLPPRLTWPLPNVWLGVSAEDQTRADERIPELLATPAAVRFASLEPLLGPIDLRDFQIPVGQGAKSISVRFGVDGIAPASVRPPLDWVIVGGESGKGARPMHPAWARTIRDQCTAAGVAFFFKQWGAWHADALLYTEAVPDGRCPPPDMRIGKARAGRLLDGREWNEYPFPAPSPCTAVEVR